MKHVYYGLTYLFNYHILKKHMPLICGITVTNQCNLDCLHCRVAGRGARKLTYEDSINAIDSFYIRGGRTLYFQGGEPFLWRDKKYRLDDLVTYARNTGYLATIIYTNGTFPLETSADTVFISMDGLENTHNYLRGTTFGTIMHNIQSSRHPSLYINYTINNRNKKEIEEFCTFINNVNNIRGIFFYFHTPYYGTDDLYIKPSERNTILHELITLKKRFKILNSRAGLISALKNDWKRPLDICQVFEKGRIYKCCRTRYDPELCRNCGYLSYPEIDQTLKLKPTAIFNALKYF